jgi:5-methylcytosine-specific restriction endonuclease McrA
MHELFVEHKIKRRFCACNKNVTSCPAARRFTFDLQSLKEAKRRAIRGALRRKAPRNLLLLLRHSFSETCQYCGCSVGNDATIDRITPGALGGTYDASNVTLSCRRCNSSKHSRPFLGTVRSYYDVGGRYA